MSTARTPIVAKESTAGDDGADANALSPKDKRKYKRRKLDAEVRFTTSDSVEATGKLHDISEGGLYMECDLDLAIGDQVIAYPEGLGRVEGTVVRKDKGGVAIQFSISSIQREYLAKRIDSAQIGAPYLRLVERRRHERTPLNLDVSAYLVESETLLQCTLLDISRSGAAARSEERPPIGAPIKIGMLKGNIDRHTDDGFIIVFGADAR